jgi:hypothetical protein
VSQVEICERLSREVDGKGLNIRENTPETEAL